jgi:hypothetical protein
MRYYDVLADDQRFPDRWFLDEPLSEAGEQIDAREFRYGRPYVGLLPVRVPIQQEGRVVKFTLAAFDMPIVSDDVAQIVQRIAPEEVECFPVLVGAAMISGYAILNAVCQEACVDEERSEFMRWMPEDGRPDKVGKYRMISEIVIDSTRTHHRHIFRIEDFVVALIVSDKIKRALEGLPDLGVVFKPV